MSETAMTIDKSGSASDCLQLFCISKKGRCSYCVGGRYVLVVVKLCLMPVECKATRVNEWVWFCSRQAELKYI